MYRISERRVWQHCSTSNQAIHFINEIIYIKYYNSRLHSLYQISCGKATIDYCNLVFRKNPIEMSSSFPEIVTCRTCTKECSEYKALHKPGIILGEVATLADILNYCTNIDFSNEEGILPWHVCSSCVHSLILCFRFKKMAIEADEIFRKQQLELLEQEIQSENEFLIMKSEIAVGVENFQINQINGDFNREIKCDDDYENLNGGEEYSQPAKTEDQSEEDEEDNEVNNLPLVCTLCNQECASQSDWEEHLKSHENINDNINEDDENTVFKCSVCEKVFTKLNLLRAHSLTHTGERPFECQICGFAFAQKAYFAQHMLMHTGEKPFQCDICGRIFRSRSNLRTHKQLHSNESPFKCLHCDLSFSTPRKRKRHIIKQHTTERPHFCDICQKTFLDSTALRKHKILHTDEKPYTCQECKESFRTWAQLSIHRREHSADKTFDCPECGLNFASGQQRKRHLLIHTGERPYACNLCNRSYRDASSLSTHMLSHQEEKPFQCEHCGKGFISKSDYKKHLLIHTGEKPYSCDVCGRKFANSSNLSVHKRLHLAELPHKCAICSKSFPTAERLKRHSIVHSRERPFQCLECGKRFKHRNSLITHKHNGEDGRNFEPDMALQTEHKILKSNVVELY